MDEWNDPDAPTVVIDVSGTLRGLMDVANVALGDDMPPPSAAEAMLLLRALLATVKRVMPEDLQAQDKRVEDALGLLQIYELFPAARDAE
jgi:hypothetical protein